MCFSAAPGESRRAILHIDGDAFFASCEQARDPLLRGKPVITGKERGIASSMSYEAKARGITRGMRLFEIRKICPEAIILPSDYETYSLLSERFFSIVRHYTPDVEEYGIDECFADITGWRRPHRKSYAGIATAIQEDLRRELGFTFSIGLAHTKVLAKIGSKWKKPYGFTEIRESERATFLAGLPVEKVWGIGPQTASLLASFGIRSALDLARRDESWVRQFLSKPFVEIWEELNGRGVLSLQTAPKTTYLSIQKMKTFTPPSTDPTFVFSQLARNIESAAMKARRFEREAKKMLLLLRTQEFRHRAVEVAFTRPTNFTHELLALARPAFDTIFQGDTRYRATLVALLDLAPGDPQPDLFGASLRADRMRVLYESLDALREKYGKYTVHFGATSLAKEAGAHSGDRGDTPRRYQTLLPGETSRRRLGIPILEIS